LGGPNAYQGKEILVYDLASLAASGSAEPRVRLAPRGDGVNWPVWSDGGANLAYLDGAWPYYYARPASPPAALMLASGPSFEPRPLPMPAGERWKPQSTDQEIEDKETGTLTALAVSPLSRAEYVAGRSVLGLALALPLVFGSLWVFGAGPFNGWQVLAVSLGGAFLAVIYGLYTGSVSENQISGIATVKFGGLVFLVAPLLSSVIPAKWQAAPLLAPDLLDLPWLRPGAFRGRGRGSGRWGTLGRGAACGGHQSGSERALSGGVVAAAPAEASPPGLAGHDAGRPRKGCDDRNTGTSKRFEREVRLWRASLQASPGGGGSLSWPFWPRWSPPSS